MTNSVTLNASHYALLQDAITESLGPLAGNIIRTLCDRGPLTLKELSDAARKDPYQPRTAFVAEARQVHSSLQINGDDGNAPVNAKLSDPNMVVDASVKELVTRLLLHRVVCYNAATHTFHLLLGDGILLHVLYPLVAHAVRSRYGEAGECLFLTLRQLAVLPWSTVQRLVSERRPVLAEAIARVAAQMGRDGWIEYIPSSAPLSTDGTEQRHQRPGAGVKRTRDDATTAADDGVDGATRPCGIPPDVCRLSIDTILWELLHDAILQWVAEHFVDGGLAVSIISAFIRASRSSATFSHSIGASRDHSYPPSPAATASPQLSAQQVMDRIYGQHPRTSLEAVQQTLHRLSSTPLTTGSARDRPVLSREDGGLLYSLHFATIIGALQLAVCERVVFARHGVLGVRLAKLLLRHHLLEDKTLAEEAITTQPRTREALHAMMKDGYVYQQEVSRNAANADRIPKHSLFLWGASFEQSVAPVVRGQTAKSVHHAVLRLRHVLRANEAHAASAAAALRLPSLQQDTPRLGASRLAALQAMAPQLSERIHGRSNSRDPAAGVASEVLRRAVRAQRQVVGLESCALSLMRSVLLLDYYDL